MKTTERDIEILKFINQFGFCEITQIEKKFSIKKRRCYQVMQRLVQEKFVIHKRIFHGANGIFYLNKQGIKFSDFLPGNGMTVASYHHQLAIIDLYFKLTEKHPEAQWISERRLKYEKLTKGIGSTGHIADGLLIFPDDTQIAIELELTMKSKRRLEKIFRTYGGQFAIKEVWYFCSPDVLPKMKKLAERKSYIKIFAL